MLKIFKASAGSGKTYQLAKEYITLLLGYYDSESGTHKLYLDHPLARDTHKRILAITFTLKATEEMKKRIVKRLYELSSGKKSDYLEDLQKFYNASETKIRLGAKKALQDLLSKFSFFNVNTIDSFFQTILRAMAFELDQSGDFAVEINDDMVLSVALQDLIWSLRSGYHVDDDKRKLRSRLEKYLLGNIDGKGDWSLFSSKNGNNFRNDYSSLSNIVKYINSEGFKLKAEDIKEYFNNSGSLEKFKDDIEKQMDGILMQILHVAKSLPDTLEAAGLQESQLSRINSQPFSVVYRAMGLNTAQEAKDALDSLLPNDTFLAKYQSPESFLKSGASPVAAIPVSDLLARYLSLFRKYGLLKMSIENLDALSLIFDVYMQMEKYREDNDTVLLSQTTEFLSKIVTADDAPFIYERMGVAPRHFLIDEFQDTSKMQWQILDPLLQNNLSEGNSSLIIGDVKQSIYRFRNADPSLLHSGIETDYSGQIAEGDEDKMPKISTNYRSRENIVKFNNTFFSLLSGILALDKCAPLIESSYSNVVQHVAKNKVNTGGYVTIDFVAKEDTAAASDEESTPSTYTPYMEKALQYALDAIKRGYKPSDIAFLSSLNTHGEAIVNYLIEHLDELTIANGGTPVTVVSDESLLLRNSSIINAIIGLLQFISGEDVIGEEFDTENRNLYLPLIAQYFHRKLAENGGDASSALQQAMDIPVKELRNDLVESLDSGNGSLYTVIERIIDTFDAEARDKETAYLLAFQDVVIDYTNTNTATIPAFLKWWNNNSSKLSITTPPNENAINVMTIHKSKGLEFEVLIIPMCTWSVLPIDKLMWFDTTPIRPLLDSESTPPVIPMLTSGNLFSGNKSIKKADCIAVSDLNPHYQAEVEKALADGLNLSYVAFTRAGSELHIIMPGGTKSNKDSIAVYTQDILKKEDSFYERFIYNRFPDIDAGSHFIYLNGSFSWGEPTAPLPQSPNDEDDEAKKEAEKYKVQQHILSSYKVSTNDVEPEYSADIIPPGPRGEGVRMHKIMEGIRNANDVRLAVRRCAARGFIDDSEATIDKYTRIFTGYISQPEPSAWFAPGLKAMREQWMYHKGKQRRADRVVVFPDGSATVIDYKFGEDAANIFSDDYLYQIRNYMYALKASGYSRVIGKIWHPESGEIRTVTFKSER